ncbi:MAG: hypothetical protein AB7O52_01620 [Planctomycetota bacterium]
MQQEDESARRVCADFQLPFANLRAHKIPSDLLVLVSPRVTHTRQVLPVAMRGEVLILATPATPGAARRVHAAALDLARVWEPALATPAVFGRLLRQTDGPPESE